jgi:hypothetical protein
LEKYYSFLYPLFLGAIKQSATMKKVLSLILLAGMFSFYACGLSAEEKAAQDKAAQDSVAAAEAKMKDAEAAAMATAAPDSTKKDSAAAPAPDAGKK